jgi:hypothetical protein
MGRERASYAKITPIYGRNFPKKILVHQRIPINENYAFTVSIWIADTPESNKKPTINLVMSHGNHNIRLCFNSVTEMNEAVTMLKNFVLDKSFKVNDAYNEALLEFLEHHEGKRMQSLSNNTALTVIQDITENRYSGKREFVNKITGEISRV